MQGLIDLSIAWGLPPKRHLVLFCKHCSTLGCATGENGCLAFNLGFFMPVVHAGGVLRGPMGRLSPLS